MSVFGLFRSGPPLTQSRLSSLDVSIVFEIRVRFVPSKQGRLLSSWLFDRASIQLLSAMERPRVAFSAPGKVLLAGGYLVLDRDYTGLVFGLDARIHVHVQTLQTSPGLALSEIIVRSPQFRDAEWRYGYRETEENGGIEVTQLKG